MQMNQLNVFVFITSFIGVINYVSGSTRVMLIGKIYVCFFSALSKTDVLIQT